MQFDGFDWDTGNLGKCQKHGVAIREIEELFNGRVAVYADPAHSIVEQRLRAIGKIASKRWVFCVFTIRERQGEIAVRPISARFMHADEVAYYEKEIASSSDR